MRSLVTLAVTAFCMYSPSKMFALIKDQGNKPVLTLIFSVRIIFTHTHTKSSTHTLYQGTVSAKQPLNKFYGNKAPSGEFIYKVAASIY
jgi:hypothetical protein